MSRDNGTRTVAKIIIEKPGVPQTWLSLEEFDEYGDGTCVRCKKRTRGAYKLFKETRQPNAGTVEATCIRQQPICPQCRLLIDDALTLLVDPEFLAQHKAQCEIRDGKYLLRHRHKKLTGPLMYAMWEYGIWGLLPSEAHQVQIEANRADKARKRAKHEATVEKNRRRREQMQILRKGLGPTIEAALQTLQLPYEVIEAGPKRALYRVYLDGKPVDLLFFPNKEAMDGYYNQPRTIARQHAVWLVEIETLPLRIKEALGLN